MPPILYESGKPIQHPLEARLRASAWDILTAIEHGHRARTGVKGQLAELFLSQEIQALKARGQIDSYSWSDTDGEPDFLLTRGQRVFRLECKNVRSGKSPRAYGGAYRLEIWKSRSTVKNILGRYYRIDEFDAVAACLFNQTERWNFLCIKSAHLARHPDDAAFLDKYQLVPVTAQGVWKATLSEVVAELLGESEA